MELPRYMSTNLLAQSPPDFRESAVEFTYKSLVAGSYNRVWDDLTMERSINESIKTEPLNKFVPKQLTRRLGTIALSVAILPVSNSSSDLLILCSLHVAEVPIHRESIHREYLCLPTHSLGASALCAKNAPPRRTKLQDHSSDISFQRNSIEMKPEPERLPGYLQQDHQ
jgi:hypothetical protein